MSDAPTTDFSDVIGHMRWQAAMIYDRNAREYANNGNETDAAKCRLRAETWRAAADRLEAEAKSGTGILPVIHPV